MQSILCKYEGATYRLSVVPDYWNVGHHVECERVTPSYKKFSFTPYYIGSRQMLDDPLFLIWIKMAFGVLIYPLHGLLRWATLPKTFYDEWAYNRYTEPLYERLIHRVADIALIPLYTTVITLHCLIATIVLPVVALCASDRVTEGTFNLFREVAAQMQAYSYRMRIQSCGEKAEKHSYRRECIPPTYLCFYIRPDLWSERPFSTTLDPKKVICLRR